MLLAFVSPYYIESEWCQFEIEQMWCRCHIETMPAHRRPAFAPIMPIIWKGGEELPRLLRNEDGALTCCLPSIDWRCCFPQDWSIDPMRSEHECFDRMRGTAARIVDVLRKRRDAYRSESDRQICRQSAYAPQISWRTVGSHCV